MPFSELAKNVQNCSKKLLDKEFVFDFPTLFNQTNMSRDLKKKESLYFIAIVPPSPIYEEAHDFKVHFKDHYRSKASLNSPPHITLHMPFKWKAEKESKLLEEIKSFTDAQQPFMLTLKNFSCFSPKVIFIDVETNSTLNTFQKELHKFCKIQLNIFNADYREQPFYPHLTLAFRDLKKPAFGLAWQEFKDKTYTGTFKVTSITLLKHTGKVWKILEQFSLQ